MENLDPPSPQIKDRKMARFCPSRHFILDLGGGWGFAVPFYFVQDCSKLRLHCRLAYPEVSVKAIRFKVFPTNEVIF